MAGLVRIAVSLVIASGLAWSVSAEAQGPITVKLAPQNNSGESGTATLTEEGTGKTKVTLEITGGPAGARQPTHIHKGTCAQIDPKPAYPLADVVNGKSETTIDVALASLQGEKFAINGHKSAQEASVYVFCGDLPGR